MVPKVLFFLVPTALLLVSLVSAALWDRMARPSRASAGDGDTEGAFRAFYHALWVLILWSGLCLSFPLWVSYRERLLSLPLPERWQPMARVLLLPVTLLLLLWYGGRQGYLKWIDSLRWPDGEGK